MAIWKLWAAEAGGSLWATGDTPVHLEEENTHTHTHNSLPMSQNRQWLCYTLYPWCPWGSRAVPAGEPVAGPTTITVHVCVCDGDVGSQEQPVLTCEALQGMDDIYFHVCLKLWNLFSL